MSQSTDRISPTPPEFLCASLQPVLSPQALATIDLLSVTIALPLKFLDLFLAVLGLHCCTQSFSSYGEQGLLP